MVKALDSARNQSEYTEYGDDVMTYQLCKKAIGGNYREHHQPCRTVYLDIANQIIVEAKHRFPDMDTNIIVPLADHIAFAARSYSKWYYYDQSVDTGYLWHCSRMSIK